MPAALNVAPPVAAADVIAYGGTLDPDGGHSQWIDGNVPQSGFTTVFTPNSLTPYTDPSGATVNVNFTSMTENASRDLPTYAAITARSYHPGLVNVFLMDGAVRAVGDNISLEVWRALGTRSSGEVVGDY